MALAHCLHCGSKDVWQARRRTICNDGVSLSIQVGENLYCNPRDNSGQYSQVEVGFIEDSEGRVFTPPDEWKEYVDSYDVFPHDVYAYVPVDIVERFIAAHGGRKYFV